MACKVVEHLGNRGKRLIELRGHLHEVTGHAGAAQMVILAIRQYAVEGMAELMEHGRHLVPSEQ